MSAPNILDDDTAGGGGAAVIWLRMARFRVSEIGRICASARREERPGMRCTLTVIAYRDERIENPSAGASDVWTRAFPLAAHTTPLTHIGRR